MKVLLPPKYIPTWITNFYEVKFSHITPEIPTNKFMIIKPKLKDYKKFADRFYSKSNIYLQKYMSLSNRDSSLKFHGFEIVT